MHNQWHSYYIIVITGWSVYNIHLFIDLYITFICSAMVFRLPGRWSATVSSYFLSFCAQHANQQFLLCLQSSWKESVLNCLIAHNYYLHRSQSQLDTDPKAINLWFVQNKVLYTRDAVGWFPIYIPFHTPWFSLWWQHPSISTCHFHLREMGRLHGSGWKLMLLESALSEWQVEIVGKYPTSLPLYWNNSEKYSTLSTRVLLWESNPVA